jgi:hypothetical protein
MIFTEIQDDAIGGVGGKCGRKEERECDFSGETVRKLSAWKTQA